MAARIDLAGAENGFLKGNDFGTVKRQMIDRNADRRQRSRVNLHRPVAGRMRGFVGRVVIIVERDRLDAGAGADDDFHALFGEAGHGVDREKREQQQGNEQDREDQSFHIQLSQCSHHGEVTTEKKAINIVASCLNSVFHSPPVFQGYGS